jgi:hypothetical protein
MSAYEWQDKDGDRADVTPRSATWATDAVALLTVCAHNDDEHYLQVYISAEQAKELEAFFAGLVMSLPAEQRA